MTAPGQPAAADAGTVTVTTTFLHLPSPDHFRPATLAAADLILLPLTEPLPAYYRFLYTAVGRDYHWVDRLGWSDERLWAHLLRPSVTVLVLYWRGAPAGYIELNRDSAEPGTEVAYFGIVPAFHGRGFGKHLLSVGVQRALDDGAARVWLHTCTLDGRHALTNYRARGFVPYRTVNEILALQPPAAEPCR